MSIIFHTASSDVDFASKKFKGVTFKFPDAFMHYSQHYKLSSSFLDLHSKGEEVNIVTFSGYLFWATLEEGLIKNCLSRKDLFINFWSNNNLNHKFNLGSKFEMSAILGQAHWDGGQHRVNVYNMHGLYKTDKVSQKDFE